MHERVRPAGGCKKGIPGHEVDTTQLGSGQQLACKEDASLECGVFRPESTGGTGSEGGGGDAKEGAACRGDAAIAFKWGAKMKLVVRRTPIFGFAGCSKALATLQMFARGAALAALRALHPPPINSARRNPKFGVRRTTSGTTSDNPRLPGPCHEISRIRTPCIQESSAAG